MGEEEVIQVKGWEVGFVAVNTAAAQAEIDRQAPVPYREGLKRVVGALETDQAVEVLAGGDFKGSLALQIRDIQLVKH